MSGVKNTRMAIGVFALCVGLTALGGWATYQEAAVYFNPGSTSLRRLSLLPATGAAPGLAPTTQAASLQDCYRAMLRTSSSGNEALSAGIQAEMQLRCADMAARAVAVRPTDAFAWTVAAGAQAAAGNWSAFNIDLRVAQAIAPSEQWIAELRVELAETHYAQLEQGTIAGNDADLSMLVLSERGIGSIADRYIDQDDFRERVANIVEKLPDERQRKFVNTLKRRIALRQTQPAS